MRPYEGTLDFQLTLMAADFGPYSLEILTAVSVIQWAEGHIVWSRRGFMNLAHWHSPSSHHGILRLSAWHIEQESLQI